MLWLLALAAACSGDLPTLAIDLQTDFVAGVEFDRAIPAIDGRPLAPTFFALGDTFRAPARVGEAADLAIGVRQVRVALQRGAEVVAERTIVVDLRSSTIALVVITRSCAGVECPPRGAPEATECLGGECVPPRCTTLDGASCPAPSCHRDSDCASSESCVIAVCSTGACLSIPGESCGASAYCDPDEGCVPRSTLDAGPGDASMDARATDSPAGLDVVGPDAPGSDAPGSDAPGSDAPGSDAPGSDAERDAGAIGVDAGPACPSSCDDGNPCTDDRCEDGACVHPFNGAPCDDGDLCTTADRCRDGVCMGGPPNPCSDGNPCTRDNCSGGACVNVAVDGLPCDDGEPCSLETCSMGRCALIGSPSCNDDGNPCTVERCAPGVGCVSEPAADNTPCGDPVTRQRCCGATCASITSAEHCGACNSPCIPPRVCGYSPGNAVVCYGGT